MAAFSWILIAIISVCNAISDFHLIQNTISSNLFTSVFAGVEADTLFLVGGAGSGVFRYKFDLSSLTSDSIYYLLNSLAFKQKTYQPCPDLKPNCDIDGLYINNARTSSNTFITAVYLGSPGSVSNELFIYDVLNTEWRDSTTYNYQAPGILTDLCMATSTITNSLYVFGVYASDSADFLSNYNPGVTFIFDYTNDQWRTGSNMITPAWKPGCASDKDQNNIYIVGGSYIIDGYHVYGDQIQQYSLSNDVWASDPAIFLITPRTATRCVSNPFKNEIICIGGEGDSGSLGTAEVFQIDTMNIYQVAMANNAQSIAVSVWVHESQSFGYIFAISPEGIQYVVVDESQGTVCFDSYCGVGCTEDGSASSDCSFIDGSTADTLDVSCGSFACEHNRIDCASSQCIINCNERNACTYVTINAYEYTTVTINCQYVNACDNIVVNADHADQVQLYCYGESSCTSMNIDASAVGSITMDFRNNDAYSGGMLNASNAGSVSITCSSSDWYNVCHGSEWYLPNYGYNTWITCYGNACSGFGTIYVEESISALSVTINSCQECSSAEGCIGQWDISCNTKYGDQDRISWYGSPTCSDSCDCSEFQHTVSFYEQQDDSLCGYGNGDIQTDNGPGVLGIILPVLILLIICGVVIFCCVRCNQSGRRPQAHAGKSAMVRTTSAVVVKPQTQPQQQQPVVMMSPQQPGQQQQVRLVQVMPSGSQQQGAKPQYMYVQGAPQMQAQPIQSQQTLSAQQPVQIAQTHSLSAGNAPPLYADAPPSYSAPSAPSGASAPPDMDEGAVTNM